MHLSPTSKLGYLSFKWYTEAGDIQVICTELYQSSRTSITDINNVIGKERGPV